MLGLDLPDELPETVSAVLCCARCAARNSECCAVLCCAVLCCAVLDVLPETVSALVCAAVSILTVYSMWCDM